MKMLVSIAVLFACVFVIDKTDAVCCRYHCGRCQICKDCTRGTPYCGKGKCNMFGCACKRGCRRGKCFREGADELDATEVFSMYDLNRNDMIEYEEFIGAFSSFDLTDDEWVAQWARMDENQDGVITIDEFDD